MKAYKKYYEKGDLVYYVDEWTGKIFKSRVQNTYLNMPSCYDIAGYVHVESYYLAPRNKSGLKHIKQISESVMKVRLVQAKNKLLYAQKEIESINNYLNKKLPKYE